MSQKNYKKKNSGSKGLIIKQDFCTIFIYILANFLQKGWKNRQSQKKSQVTVSFTSFKWNAT